MEALGGTMLIGGEPVFGGHGEVRSVEAATGKPLEPAFGAGGADEVARACALAEEAFDTFRETAPEERARFLEAIADAILVLGDELIVRVMAESGLPRARLEGERGRTVGQLRLFAGVLREGSWAGVRIDPPMSDPISIGTKPAASAAAAPPDEPPLVRSGLWGFSVRPWIGLFA